MAKRNWNPWTTPGEMDKDTERFLRDHRTGTGCVRGDKGFVWTPCADVIESQQGFIIQVELPGISLKQVNVELKEGALWIWGERALAKEPETHVYHALECSYGPFARSFRLPVETDKNSIAATYKDGLLTVTIDKKHMPSRVIQVK